MSDRTDWIMGLVALVGSEIGVRDKIEQEVAALETDLMQHASENQRLRSYAVTQRALLERVGNVLSTTSADYMPITNAERDELIRDIDAVLAMNECPSSPIGRGKGLKTPHSAGSTPASGTNNEGNGNESPSEAHSGIAEPDAQSGREGLASVAQARMAVASGSAEAIIHTDHPFRHYDRTCPGCVHETARQPALGSLSSPQTGAQPERHETGTHPCVHCAGPIKMGESYVVGIAHAHADCDQAVPVNARLQGGELRHQSCTQGTFADGMRHAASIVEDFRQSTEEGDTLAMVIEAIQKETGVHQVCNVPEGWRLVPTEPTEVMQDEAARELGLCKDDANDPETRQEFRVCYRAMVFSAPTYEFVAGKKS